MKNIARHLVKQTNRSIKKLLLDEQFDSIEKAKLDSHSDRMPNGLIDQLIINTASITPWLTYDMVMNYYMKRMKEIASRDLAGVSIASELAERQLVVRESGGRPKGSTNLKRRIGDLAIIATVNDIAS